MFDRLLKEAGLPHLPFHSLRHSSATLLLSMGVNVRVVQDLLGYSNISMTMDVYSHVLPSMHKDAMDKWDDALRRVDKGENIGTLILRLLDDL